MIKHLEMLLLTVALGGFCLEVGHKVGISGMGGLVTPVEAIVNRPLTPVTVPEVARRTPSMNICSVSGPAPAGAQLSQLQPGGGVTYYYC